MNKLQILKSALAGGASALALVHPASAKLFNIPDGDLATALGAYMQQSGIEIVYFNDAVRGHHTHGAKGDFTETAALTQILQGTGFAAQTMSPSAIGIVPEKKSTEEIHVAQAARRAPAVPPLAPAQAGVETVVVTAQKKSENIQQVPIAITALSQQQLTERQIAGGPDLVKEVPNLTFSKTNFSGYNLEIRGVGTQAISVTTDPAVAVAFNDTPFIRNHFFEQEFYDLGDLEVLRGPQGTLYGRNATGGVVNIKSALPVDQYEAMLSADIGNYGNRRYEGMLNIPVVGDTLDIRIAGEWTKRDGYSEDTTLNTPIDGRDLWSGRVTLGWKPTSDIQTYLVWEHFSEDDARLRSGKQLCKTAPIPTNIDGVNPFNYGPPGVYASAVDYLSQGCEDTSLYSPSAYEVPNGYSLAYYAPLAAAGVPIGFGDPYAETTQSTNLRDIQSAVMPRYIAKNDTLEFNADWNVSPSLTLTSQTGYNNDFLWSTEDYNRFDSAPGAFLYDPTTNGENGRVLPGGIFCDPQLGCSDRLVLQDLSDEHAWQFSQEFRLASNFSGPLNFSVGGNFLHYETEENYYVFVNSLTLFSLTTFDEGFPYVPGVTTNQPCLLGGFRYSNPSTLHSILDGCKYIDPNPLTSVNGEGHNYFLSKNPYLLNSYATFGEAYYNVTNNLKLTAGLRFTDDRKSFIDIPSELLISGYGYPTAGVVKQQWDQFTGRIVVDWTPQLDFTDQTLVYASYSHGYKAGGANPPGAYYPTVAGDTDVVTNPIHPLTFKPEFIEAFELGAKNTLLGGALTLNGDLFYYNYANYQISEIVDRTAINSNYNAHMEGAEFETNWEPLPGLKFSLAQGFENTGLAGGDEGIDLMDRTAGTPGWMVVKPYVTTSSNCILPDYVVAAAVQTQTSFYNVCPIAYNQHLDPATSLPYVPNPTVSNTFGYPLPSGYPGFDPSTAPNNGEGFDKKLGGNQLPNAPHFTSSLTAEYTMPVADDWAATLHADFYWQSQQWARVFEDAIDKIHGYSTTNVSLILNSSNGWQVMAYVKNVFDVTAITGTFLNSDDSGLTTNIFLTDPRLFGIRVTKQLDQADGFWGSDWSGNDFFTGLFSDTDNGKPSLWIELGGQLSRLDDSQQTFSPPFMSTVANRTLLSALDVQQPSTYSLDDEAKLSFQPDGSDWVFSASVRYGRSAVDKHIHKTVPNGGAPVDIHVGTHYLGGFSYYASSHVKFADGQSKQSESHAIIDFLVGKDVGLGMFGGQGSSVLSGGVRVAQFTSKSNATLQAIPDLQYPTAPITTLPEFFAFRQSKFHFHDYLATIAEKQSFHGLGPDIDWKASMPVVNTDQGGGEITFDWGANASVIFGRQKALGHHQTTTQSYYLTAIRPGANSTDPKRRNFRFYLSCYSSRNKFNGKNLAACGPRNVAGAPHNRSRMVAVPNLGGFAGISVKYNNAKVSFGYRADEFFGAMDGGIDERKTYNHGFFGPYANISIGFGNGP